MAWRQGRNGSGKAGAFDLRLRPQDRIGGPPKGRRGGSGRRADSSPRRGKTRRAGGKRRSTAGRVFYWGAVAALWAFICAIGVVIWIGIHLPPIQSLEIPKRPPSVLIVGANGATLATRGDMGGAAVPLSELPDYVPKAFIAIEDRRFYSHHGVDPFGILRALAADILRRGASQGGSTITQ
jgi:penicillin-binding protein 1A